MKEFSTFLILLLGLVSCAGPKLTNNDRGNYDYRSISDPKEVLDVTVSVLPLPDPPEKTPEKAKTFFDLRDSIPNTYLRVIGSKANNTKEVIEAVKEPLSVVKEAKTAPVKEINDHEIKLRFLFTNSKKYYNREDLMHSNTRLEFLNTSLKLNSTDFYIYTIDKLENEFEKVDMGTLEREQDVSFESKLTGEAGTNVSAERTAGALNTQTNQMGNSQESKVYDEAGNLIGILNSTNGSNTTNTENQSNTRKLSNALNAKADLRYANSETIKEALHIKYNKLKTGYAFTPTKLTLSQRGAVLTDISDMVFVTATLRLAASKVASRDVIEFKNLLDDKGRPQPLDKLDKIYRRVNYIPCSGTISDITMEVNYEGALRAVKNLKRGRNTLEFDDKVMYYRFEDSLSSSFVFEKAAHCQTVYRVEARFGKDNAAYVLSGNISDPEYIYLYGKHNPKALIDWMLKTIYEGGSTNLNDPGHGLFFVNLNTSDIINFSKKDLTRLKTIRSISLIDVYKP